jgi:uncharacterized membrane protein
MSAPQKPHIHMPQPSFWPILLALGVLLIAMGIIFHLLISALGVILLLGAMIGWMVENRVEAVGEEVAHD